LVGGRQLFAKDVINPTPQKLLNYLIQSGETFYNVNSIKGVQAYLATRKKSCILLYTYDSILLDYSEEDGRDTLVEIKRLMEESGFKVSVSYGKNYNSLK